LENYFHHVSKFIVDLCVKHGIGRIIIGKNDGWKQSINLGKKNNQAFCFVPTYLLLEKIKYRAAIAGIDVTFTEESYTSKASFYDRDPLPAYEKGVTHTFSGRRKHRGLYVSKDGFAINADVNGSLNIGRKVIPEFLGIGDRSIAAMPVVINPLKA
jgi:putative transposase